ncbi:MAG: LD-carboxypeptidase [Clostridium sp.]
MIKPRALEFNDEIGIIAPAGPAFNEEQFTLSIDKIKSMGFKPIIGKCCYMREGYLAGSDIARSSDINIFFHSSSIKAIVSLRGGYGSMRLLDMIDYSIIKKNPKILIGYSDITAIHCAINRKLNMTTFHGPMVYSDFYRMDKSTERSLLRSIMDVNYKPSYQLDPIVDGNISGRIFGGNLTMLCSIIGSKYEATYKDKILFIEEICEEPYKIDRMLNQLLLRGVFHEARGIILGQFTDCNPSSIEKSFLLDKVLGEFFTKHNIISFKGLNIGHDNQKITLPLGSRCRVENTTLIIEESGVR